MSASFRATRVVRDVVYRVVHDTPLHLDLHLPVDSQPRAGLVYFHGGSWRHGSRTDHEQTRAVALAARGFVVATVQYRFSDTAVFPAQLDDARAAVEWLRAELPQHGVQHSCVGAWGASAGGNLAALLALGARETAPEVAAAVSWFAPLDLTTLTATTSLEERLFPNSPVTALLGRTFDRAHELCRAAEPLSMVSSNSSPLLLMTGDRDRVVPESASRRMHDALVHYGVPSTLQVVGGAGHEDSEFDDPFVMDGVAAFFNRWLSD